MTNSERRIRFRQGLSSLYLPIYDELCKELGPIWAPYYGVRTMKEQRDLWRQGRELPGPIITNAKEGQSAHNYGCASDWTIFIDKKPVWMKAEDPAWQEYSDACEKFEAVWGGLFRQVDCPHNELAIDCDWTHVQVAYARGGFRLAMEKIEDSRRHK